MDLGFIYPFPLLCLFDPSTAVSAGNTTVAQHHNCSNIIPHSAHTGTGLHKLADMPNILQSAHSFIHPLLLLLLLLHCPLLYASSLPQPHPALHQYLSLYLPACLSRPLSPSHFHSYNALFCFRASLLGGWRHGWRDDFTHSTTRGEVGGAGSSILESLSLIKLNTHT